MTIFLQDFMNRVQEEDQQVVFKDQMNREKLEHSTRILEMNPKIINGEEYYCWLLQSP